MSIKIENGKKVIVLKPYTKKEIANLYGVCIRTLNKWLEPFKEEIGERRGWFYTVAQVKIIFNKLQPPSTMEI